VTQWTAPTVLALVGGFALAFVLVLPYVAWSYRRRGRLGAGHTVIALAFLVYCLALVTYTLLPQPHVDATYCATHQALGHPVWNPLQFLADMGTFQTSLLGNPALQQVLFNIALFLPWPVFVRSLFGKGPAVSVGSAFLVSLLIETTQLTGDWFLFPCPYRLFDAGDLATNTLGAAIGAAVAVALRLAPAGRGLPPAGAPRPVTTARRVLGMGMDLLGVRLLGVVLAASVQAVEYFTLGPAALDDNGTGLQDVVLGYWLPAVVLLLVVPLAGPGGTPGQRVVLLRPVAAGSGEDPSAGQVLVRFLVGSGGYFLLSGAAALTDPAQGSALASLWVLVHLVCVWRTRGHRGLTGVAARLLVVDARAGRRDAVGAAPHGPE
jgi:glycopeptide antibiotics resistance protein